MKIKDLNKNQESLARITQEIRELTDIPMTWEVFNKIMALLKTTQSILKTDVPFHAWLQYRAGYSPEFMKIFSLMEKYQDQYVMVGLTTAQAFLTCRKMKRK